MGFVAKASEKGYDVKTCGTRNLVFSSDIPTLKIHSVQSYTTTIPYGSGEHIVRHTHNLGYYAPCFVVFNSSTSTGTGQSYFYSSSVYPLNVKVYKNHVDVVVESDFDQSFSTGGPSKPGDTVYFTIYQFLENFDDFVSPKKSATPQTLQNENYGIKISKEGHDVKTCPDTDLVLSSNFGCANIHMKGKTTGQNVYHNLGYVPNILSWTEWVGDDYLTYNWYDPVDENRIFIGDPIPGTVFYYLILK